MTEVAFHFGAPDKLAYTCRLLRKAVAANATVVVVSSEQNLNQLNIDLWTLSPTDFVAHCVAGSTEDLCTRSPVLLCARDDALSGQHKVLVNLLSTVPTCFELYQRVIEVVSNDEADRQLARLRWKQYTRAGYTITRHDLALKGTGP